MKTEKIIGEGICGMQITLNVLDQHVVTEMVNQYDAYAKAKAEHDKWHEGCYNDELRFTVDPETGEKTENWKRCDWDAYRKLYPEPKEIHFDFGENMQTIMIFLRKLCSTSNERATVFSTEDEK